MRDAPLLVQGHYPTVWFDSICNLLTCSFYDLSYAPDGTMTRWMWTFYDGSGATSAEQNPTHTFAMPGTYLVRLTGFNSFGMSSNAARYVTVTVPPPVASFNVSCSSLLCSFTDTSTNQYGTITSWSWKFNQGSPSSQQNPTFLYPYAVTVSAELTVTNSYGVSNTTTKWFTLSPPVITLSAVGSRVKGQRLVDLSWSGALTSTVDLYRDGTLLLANTANDGAERTTVSANGTYSYKVCQASYCSNAVTVSF